MEALCGLNPIDQFFLELDIIKRLFFVNEHEPFE
jgi:hypothetical protein